MSIPTSELICKSAKRPSDAPGDLREPGAQLFVVAGRQRRELVAPVQDRLVGEDQWAQGEVRVEGLDRTSRGFLLQFAER